MDEVQIIPSNLDRIDTIELDEEVEDLDEADVSVVGDTPTPS